MKKFLLFLFLSLYLQIAFSQNFIIKWDMRIGGNKDEALEQIFENPDGTIVLAGNSNSPVSGDKSQPNWDTTLLLSDYWIVKCDSAGNKLWDKRFGGIDDEFLWDAERLPDGGYILGGYSFSDSSGDKLQHTQGATDYWVVRTDALGNLLWEKRFGGTTIDNMASLALAHDGGFLLGGLSLSGVGGDKTEPSWGGFDYWVVKIDSLGNKLWDKRYGGMLDDNLDEVQSTSDGGFVLAGFSRSFISGDKTEDTEGNWDYWIVKIDSLGNKLWDRDYGGTDVDWLFSMVTTSDGGFALAGSSFSGMNGDKTDTSRGWSDYWLVKLDPAGNFQWDKTYGGTDFEEMTKVTQTPDGGYLLAGDSYSPISGEKTENNLGIEQTWAVKTDSLGNKLWDRTMLTTGHDEECTGIRLNDGCYLLANLTAADTGGYKTQFNWGAADWWMIKICDDNVSVNENPAAGFPFFVYPNPASGELTISLSSHVEPVHLILSDAAGRTIMNFNLNSQAKISLQGIEPGFYLLKAETGNSATLRRIIIQK